MAAAVDTLVAGRHFPHDSDARSIGYRALAVNLSDLAAMGATPAWATLALTLPSADPEWLERFSGGLSDLADAHGGGAGRRRYHLRSADRQRADPGSCRARLGAAPQRRASRRPFGGDRYAWRCRRRTGSGEPLPGGAMCPQPHASSSSVSSTRRRGSNSARLPAESRARPWICPMGWRATCRNWRAPAGSPRTSIWSVCRCPRHCWPRPVRQQARDWALGAGDDYELLLAVPPSRYDALAALAVRLNLRLTRIGELRRGTGVTWAWQGEPITPRLQGYDHFR